MKRRTYMQTMLAGAGVFCGSASAMTGEIQLHVDLSVDPAQEREMLLFFNSEFKSAAMRQPGYRDARMLKLRSAIQGQAPEANYRFVLTFASEELRQKWVASAIHQRLWPRIENTLRSKNYTVLLYDVS